MRDLAPLTELFPIRDAASARLMALKAERLHAAGAISAAARQRVLRRAAPYLDGGRSQADATAPTSARLLLT